MQRGDLFHSKDHLDRVLVIVSSILTAVSIIITVLDIVVKTMLSR